MSTGLAEKCLKTVILVIWILRALGTVDDYMKYVEPPTRMHLNLVCDSWKYAFQELRTITYSSVLILVEK